jgi:hypothetical protein
MQHNSLPDLDKLGTIRVDVYQADLSKPGRAHTYAVVPAWHAHRSDNIGVRGLPSQSELGTLMELMVQDGLCLL